MVIRLSVFRSGVGAGRARSARLAPCDVPLALAHPAQPAARPIRPTLRLRAHERPRAQLDRLLARRARDITEIAPEIAPEIGRRRRWPRRIFADLPVGDRRVRRSARRHSSLEISARSSGRWRCALSSPWTTRPPRCEPTTTARHNKWALGLHLSARRTFGPTTRSSDGTARPSALSRRTDRPRRTSSRIIIYTCVVYTFDRAGVHRVERVGDGATWRSARRARPSAQVQARGALRDATRGRRALRTLHTGRRRRVNQFVIRDAIHIYELVYILYIDIY